MKQVLSIALAALLAATSQAQTVRLAQRVNTGGFNPNANNHQDGFGLAIRGTRVLAVWTEQNGVNDTLNDIYSSYSDDDGQTWSAMTRVDLGTPNNAHDSDQPKVVITSSGIAVAIWEEKSAANAFASSNEDLFFNRSLDGGVTWLPVSLGLNTLTGGSHVTSDIDEASIAVDGDSIYVTWEEDSLSGIGQAEDVWFTKSNDAGATWSTPIVILGNGTNDVDDPKVLAQGGTVIVALVEQSSGTDDAVALVSTNDGVTFTMTTVDSSQSGDADEVRLAFSGDVAILSWEDDDPNTPGGDSIHASISTDRGLSWSPEFSVSAKVEPLAGSQALWHDTEVQGDDIYVVYSDDVESLQAGGTGGQGGAEVYVAFSNNRGATWTFDVPLDSASPLKSHRPMVVATDCGVFVHFETNVDGANGLAYTASTNRGLNWLAPQIVVNAGPDVDSEIPNEGVTFVVDNTRNVALSLFWDRPLGQNELYVAGLAGCAAQPISYCTAGTTTNGCVPTISWSGTPSASLASPFSIEVTQVEGQKQGILFYSIDGRAAVAWGTSTSFLCVKSPTQRTGTQNAGGTLNVCDGSFSLDWNAFVQSNPTALGAPFLQGQAIYAQCWFRDPPSPKTTNLSDALEFVLAP